MVMVGKNVLELHEDVCLVERIKSSTTTDRACPDEARHAPWLPRRERAEEVQQSGPVCTKREVMGKTLLHATDQPPIHIPHLIVVIRKVGLVAHPIFLEGL